MADKAVVDTQGPNIDSILNEQRKFEPPAEFSKQAHIKSLEEYERLYKESIDRSRQVLVADRQRTALVQEVGQGS